MTATNMFAKKIFIAVSALALAVPSISFAQKEERSSGLDIPVIEKTTGMKGTFNEAEGVYKVSLPRKDLKVKIGKVKMTPPLGLTAWASFVKTGDQAMVMGDIVMTENQVNPVMDVALANGLEVTALHNHFFYDEPKIMFMHIGGMGSEEKLGAAVGKVFEKLKDTIKNPPKFPTAAIDPAKTKLDTAKLLEIIGHEGSLKDGVYKVTIGRTTKMHGYEMGKEMGVNTWAAFAGTDKQAMVDGDFAMLEDELQGVLKALRQENIQIVAIHNHMTHENPRIVFLHYWGIGPASQLAAGVKRALNTQKK